MNIQKDWPRLIFIEILVICASLFIVNLLVDFLDFSLYPAAKTPNPYVLQVFEKNVPTDQILIKKYWAEILFFLLAFFGQIAIFRLRKKIFIPKQRHNG